MRWSPPPPLFLPVEPALHGVMREEAATTVKRRDGRQRPWAPVFLAHQAAHENCVLNLADRLHLSKCDGQSTQNGFLSVLSHLVAIEEGFEDGAFFLVAMTSTSNRQSSVFSFYQA